MCIVTQMLSVVKVGSSWICLMKKYHQTPEKGRSLAPENSSPPCTSSICSFIGFFHARASLPELNTWIRFWFSRSVNRSRILLDHVSWMTPKVLIWPWESLLENLKHHSVLITQRYCLASSCTGGHERLRKGFPWWRPQVIKCAMEIPWNRSPGKQRHRVSLSLHRDDERYTRLYSSLKTTTRKMLRKENEVRLLKSSAEHHQESLWQTNSI